MKSNTLHAFAIVTAILVCTTHCANRCHSAEPPILTPLTTQGVQVSANKSFPLPTPSINAEMDADEQKQAVADIAADKGVDRFQRNSTVSPFVLDMKTIAKLDDGTQVQSIDVFFIAYGNLKTITDEKLLDDLTSPGQQKPDETIPQSSRGLTEEEIAKHELPSGKQADDTYISYATSQANVLDKVHLTLFTISQTSQSSTSDDKANGSLTLATHLDRAVSNRTGFLSEWRPIDEEPGGEPKLGEASPYYSAAFYIQATELKYLPDALFVEMHVIFAEPKGWFRGRNLLRSKLPIVIQDVIRDFRRKLAQ